MVEVVVVVVCGGGGGGGGVLVEVVMWWRRRVTLYPHCIPSVSSLYPSKERCLWSRAASEGSEWWWQRLWRVAQAEGGRV